MATVAQPQNGFAPVVVDPVVADVDGRAAALYRRALRRGEIGPLEQTAADLGLSAPDLLPAVARLVELHLLRTDTPAGDRLVPVAPEVAATRLVSPLERAMYQRREQADRLRNLVGAIARSADVGDAAVGAIDSLDGAAEIRGLFKVASEVCRRELMVLRPSHDREELLDELLSPCYDVLDREVAARVICPHRNRTGFATRARARRLAEDGAQIRTLSQVPQAAVVFDQSLAVVISLPDGGGEPTARRVRDTDVVRFLVSLFDQLWEIATPFAAAEPGYADAADDLQQSLARLMAQGLTDEVVARRLGMSVRTCRRHIAGLLRDLDAVSRFQAGVQAVGRFTVNTAPGD